MESGYRFMSSVPEGQVAVPLELPYGVHTIRKLAPGTLLLQYPYLAEQLNWLRSFDADALAVAEGFVTEGLAKPSSGLDSEAAAHDLSVWICNFVVFYNRGTHWVLNNQDGTFWVDYQAGQVLLDPYRHVLERIRECKPVTVEYVSYFVEEMPG